MKYVEPKIKSVYKSVNGINLPIFIYYPERLNDNAKVILTIHGGGWKSGVIDNKQWDGNMMRFHASRFAQLGHIGVAISYRNINIEGVDILDLINDCEDAVKYVRRLELTKHKKLVIMGDSAGAHLATMLGISDNDEIRPDCVIACNPVLDCINRFTYASDVFENRFDASPLYLNIKKSSDFLFIHGTNDKTTPVNDTKIMHQKICSSGNRSEILLLEGEEHAFILYNYKNTEEHVDKLMFHIEKYIHDN